MPRNKKQSPDVRKRKSSESKRKLRENEDYMNAERERNREANKKRQLNKEFRDQEKEQDRQAKEQRRLDKEFRDQEKEQDRQAKEQRRLDKGFRDQEKEKDREAKEKRRLDENFRGPEREQDREYRANVRKDPERYRHDLDAKNSSRYDKDFDKLLHQFQREIRLAPVHPCSSCGWVYYPDNITTLTAVDIKKKGLTDEFLDKVKCVHPEKLQFCKTCKRHIMGNKVPSLCLSNGLPFPEIPLCLQELTALEERLVALRIVFMHIKAVGSEQQLV